MYLFSRRRCCPGGVSTTDGLSSRRRMLVEMGMNSKSESTSIFRASHRVAAAVAVASAIFFMLLVG